MKRVGIFGWGIVAPRSPDIDAFARNLREGDSWLSPFEGFGPSTFFVGKPEFDFDAYRPWIEERFPPTKFPQLESKMGPTTLFAIGAFIQALGQNPGLEQTLQELGPETHVLIGTGVGDLPTQYRASLDLHRAQRRWNRFWAGPEHNEDRARFEAAEGEERRRLAEEWGVPDDPRELGNPATPASASLEDVDPEGVGPPASDPRASDPQASDRGSPESGAAASGAVAVETVETGAVDPEALEDARDEWNEFWMERSEALQRYLGELVDIEALSIDGDIDTGKLHLIRRKRQEFARLQERWGCPEPPWLSVSPNLIWNIANTPAAQVSMMGRITGPSYAPIAACSSFGVALKLARQTIAAGDARACVVGMTDPPPHPLLVAAFYRARVLAADNRPSFPLSDLRGTHISGGSCIWIVGDHDYMTARGFEPLGLEVVGVGVTSDAEHIITPSREGPRDAIRMALEDAGADTSELGSWDLHATATPGDYQEVDTLQEIFDHGLAVTARKGVFGHGMAASGGWELTAQYLGLIEGELQPTPLTADALNPEIENVPFKYVLNTPCDAPEGLAGKLSMGIGGINACVISRRWDDGA